LSTLASAALIVALAAPAAGQSSDAIEQTPSPTVPVVEPRVPFFQAVKDDFRTFFTSPETARTMIVFGTGALSVAKWDVPVAGEAQARWSGDLFGHGQTGGDFLAHVAAAGGTYAIGRLTGSRKVESVGSSLLRAQILSQTTVQVAKYAAQRGRPDGSNSKSMPSGHSASAFAAATVLQRELGWKVGIPAYAFAGWVAASRMEANRHYLSDVIMGAGVGIAAGRSVTIPVARHKLAVGVAPTPGGAMVTFTKP
jgi:membrane-associated phospholipid phosphatase